MLSSTWQKIYISAIKGLCANRSVGLSPNYENNESTPLVAKKIIDHAIAIANLGDKMFEELSK